MGRTAKFAVSNQQINKRITGTGAATGESQCSIGDQGQGTSSSTKIAQMSRYQTLGNDEPFNQLQSPADDDSESRTLANDNHCVGGRIKHEGFKDRIKKEMVTPGQTTEDHSTLEF